jgi:hypothetical protein
MMYPDSIRVTVDKSHITVLGEKLYAESIELIRELVNNAFDADAAEVRVEVGPERIVVADDGSGMDYDGLVQYFNIGSPGKRLQSRSPRFHRVRIGQFGIGKFSSLTIARRFEVITKRGSFAARVVFDKEAWEADKETWGLPLEVLAPDARELDGTTVTLSGLTRSFDPAEVEQRLVSGTPLRAEHFRVLLNDHPVTPRSLTGARLPVLEGSPFGPIHGEIVIVPASAADPKDVGIEVRVKGVMVRRDLFGLEAAGPDAMRVRGEVNADFLPVTSDRSGFILDSPEYAAFREAMGRVARDISRALAKTSVVRESRRSGRAIKEVLTRIHGALARNPEFSPFGPIPYGERQPGLGGAAVTGGAEPGAKAAGAAEDVRPPGEPAPETPPKPDKPPKKKRANPLLKRLTPDAVVKRMRFGKRAVTCVIDHFGAGGPEVFSEENAIYLNADHPLFVREADAPRAFVMYVARLFAQEIALMQDPRSPRKAFELQSRILREAFREPAASDAAARPADAP